MIRAFWRIVYNPPECPNGKPSRNLFGLLTFSNAIISSIQSLIMNSRDGWGCGLTIQLHWTLPQVAGGVFQVACSQSELGR
ncbi:MAG: hypothetical protein KME30_23640 [Iphinoe sp. HA4291-MV1]|nr:hypothetical protein [Iphinoe sp. HA4291-MV1]